MEKDLKIMNEFKIAMFELTQKGTVKTSLIEVPGGTFTRVSIIINNIKHHANNVDQMVATIQLRNQL
ncbi:hypothetical protein LNQ49_18475 [Flavobacterium sp. F-65]|uniref:Uncharacterized protein n=1 Tax=Flavobacterium pisciphilum TaxID=2893755 RepID=A0ABS8MXR0_9FLAO|nr:hypothetical protein [Flavobacterium sp. F-65]MCC9073567.1 hypothetical protein [Flavobacterium sp. F-65]